MKPPAPSYVELRCHSAFSFLDGASLPEDLVDRAVELGLPSLAVADRDGLSAAPRLWQATRRLAEEQRAPLRPILGAELTLDDGRLLLLVEDRQGYKNLSRLCTRSRMDGALLDGKVEPRLTLATVAEHARGLIALTRGCEHRLDELVQVFGPRSVYLEIQRHADAVEERANRATLERAERTGLSVVATNDVRFARPEDARLFDVLTCVRHGATVDEIGRRLPRNGERHLKSGEQMARLFGDQPDALRRTLEVAERCAFTLGDLGYRFPNYLEGTTASAPHGSTPAMAETLQQHLERLVWERADARFRGLDARTRTQLEHELRIIGKLDLAGYFLIVWDIVEYCRREHILAQGRGSAANSAVCYCLGITAVDPVKMELLFERFLSEERGEWPDIDLDLPSGNAREQVIQYVFKKYGRERVAMVANVITYRPKMAVRDCGRALGFSEAQLSRMSKMLAGWGYSDARDTIANQIAQAGFTVEDERTRLLVELSTRMLTLPRHLGQHSGGIVISRDRLDEVVPLEPASMPNRVIVQWDKEDCADLGLIKIDLLGLGMMAALADSVEMIAAHEGVTVDLAHLPADDPGIYDMLCRADTVGLFQVESRAQMATLPRMRPRCFYDIVIEVAIIRPGPIVGDLLHPYLRRRTGKELPTALHPSLEAVLARTLGVPLFQEQLMKVAMIAAGFSGGEAEELRRAMGFKRSEERMSKIAEKLALGMARRGIVGDTAAKVIHWITAFAAYGFPESHAASFALIVYASAYLKVHHPAAFYAGILNHYPMGFYHPSSLVQDAARHGIEVRPIDVLSSEWLCTLETGPAGKPALRIGLKYVRGMRQADGERIAAVRSRRLEDLAWLGAEMLTRLGEVGALAAFERGRRAALWQVSRIGRSGPLFLERSDAGDVAHDETREDGSADAGLDAVVKNVQMHKSPLAEPGPRELIAADYRIAGLTTSPHPMALRRSSLDKLGIVTAVALAGVPDRARVRVAGHVTVRQRPGTAKGFFFLTLEDETGLANVIVSPRHFDAQRPILVGAPALIVDGVLQHQEGTISIKGDRFTILDEASAPSHDFH